MPAMNDDDLKDLYENAPCGYLSMLSDGRIIKANATLANWLGYLPERLVEMHFHDLLTVTGRIFYEAHVVSLLHMQGFFDEATLDLATAGGGRLAVMANACRLPEREGHPACVRLAFFKATERRLYERELVAAKSAAEAGLSSEREVSQLREQFIAVLGHDLRNPLASISAAARIIGREPQSDRATKALALMQNSVMRMSGIITNVLDFAQGRLGGGITIKRDIAEDVSPVLQQVVDELRASFPERAIEVDFLLGESVFCDPSRIGQLASNLLSNALTHGLASEPIRVRAATGEDQFELSVANAGPPIAEEMAARLFEPFFRGEVRKSQQGLGLGLHIAAEIAKAHGGTLKVISTPAETRFTFVMPMRPE
jgi:sigma-B regulation protein RsbU (phosphoserine phosphatase)